jgi:hypothetical protein
MPPSLASLLHIMHITSSLNLMMHFFCSFSMAWMIPKLDQPSEVDRASELTEKGVHILDGRAEPHRRVLLLFRLQKRDWKYKRCASQQKDECRRQAGEV